MENTVESYRNKGLIVFSEAENTFLKMYGIGSKIRAIMGVILGSWSQGTGETRPSLVYLTEGLFYNRTCK